MTKSAAT